MAIEISRLDDLQGKPPCPRMQHCAAHYVESNSNHSYLLIYGGRNDLRFRQIQNVALNDINMLNLTTRTWTSVAIFGSIPVSRWAHTICGLDSDSSF